MRKLALCVAAVAILWSCMSSPIRKYYQIQLTGSWAEGLQTIDRILRVDPVFVDDLYDDFRILYRVSPFEVNFYSYGFWADKPGKLIGDAVSHYLAGKNVFAGVTRTVAGSDPDLVLMARIHVIEEIDETEAWFGRLAMSLEFQEFPSGLTLHVHNFDRTEKMPGKDVAHLPAVISRILEEELALAVSALARKIVAPTDR
jgi:ABC-type uncharacterized transport system auxiliary subunit